jgi:septal ring factor EnvC (AmiA/AmiB activator)
MKNFLQNLLIFFALCLCALIAIQWVRETDLRKNVQALTDTIHDKSEAIQNLQLQLRRDEDEIKRLDGIKKDLTATVKSNNVEIASLSKSLEKANVENERNLKQIENYKEAIKVANDNILKQNEDIKRQNEEMKKLAEDRNEIVKKFNDVAKQYSDLVDKWNKQQEDLAKAATNTPSKK